MQPGAKIHGFDVDLSGLQFLYLLKSKFSVWSSLGDFMTEWVLSRLFSTYVRHFFFRSAEAVLIYHWSFQLQLPDSSNEYTIIVFVLMNLFL